jgi:hypothetical protein
MVASALLQNWPHIFRLLLVQVAVMIALQEFVLNMFFRRALKYVRTQA